MRRPLVTAFVALLFATLLGLPGHPAAASATPGPDAGGHCVLDLPTGAKACYADFKSSQAAAAAGIRPKDTARAATSASSVVVVAVLFNNSAYDQSGGTLSLTTDRWCGQGTTWSGNLYSPYAYWVNSVKTYANCGIAFYQYYNQSGTTSGMLWGSNEVIPNNYYNSYFIG